jgi:3'-phosphoadenosine 5'-phosphosulfate sulfotransferase (PAPS reductase)/FAD synthetase
MSPTTRFGTSRWRGLHLQRSRISKRLDAEGIQIMREAGAESERPVMLYSVGKDSGVMLHLARKAGS